MNNIIKKSIDYSLNNFNEAFNYAFKFSRNSPERIIKSFIKMYVNEYTLSYNEQAIKALKLFSNKFKLSNDLSQYIFQA